MKLLSHKKIVLPLPPGWEVQSDETGGRYRVGIGPSTTAGYRANVVVVSEENSKGETAAAVARRNRDPLQVFDFQLLDEGEFPHDYLSIHWQEQKLLIEGIRV